MIAVQNLYYHHIIQNCSFELYPQSITVLIGENGAGKTTLFQLLTGEKIPQSGKMIYAQNVPFRLGYLPDKAPLYPHLTVQNYLKICAEMRGVKNLNEATEKALQDCHLESVRQQKCATLSHGYRQRVGLAQAIIHRPDLLILDEISNGLDFRQKQSVIQLLQELKNQLTILMSSHDWQEILALADQLYFLYRGRLHQLNLEKRFQSDLEQQIYELKKCFP